MSWKNILKNKSGLPDDFRFWPAMREFDDPEDPLKTGLRMHDIYKTPYGVRGAEICAGLLTLILAADMILLNLEFKNFFFFVFSAAGIAGFYFLAKYFFHFLFSNLFWIHMFENRVMVPGWFSWRTYDTQYGYSFATGLNEKSLEPDFVAAKNNPSGRFFENSKNVYLVLQDKPVFLASVYPASSAEKIAKRLNEAKDILELDSFGA
ncbi:MAG: hypothetical protein AB7S78_14275 [Candidatus Omnitrophota bacterium]